jgi:hypothetical protein
MIKTMQMKKIIFLSFLGLAFASKAQSIQATPGSAQAQIKPNGNIEMNGAVKATIQNNGNIVNTQNQVIGYIKQDGTIEDASHTAVGYFMSNYDVQDAGHNVIGHLRTNLDVKDANNVKLGTYNERIPTAWTAVAYFFFKP